ncbi:uncharacterized protein YoxC [Paenibacillus sp. DS2015]|uniref:DUF948 domain-containing protein n=1 Tax=Paenibacillus sp. DS2015 TaxID=3373917 RepID=UPI003D2258F7
MIIEISVAVIALAFATGIYYLVRLLQKGTVSLEETNRTLAEVRNAVHGLTNESTQLIHTANQITRDVKGKIKAVEPLLESAHDVGEVLHSVTNTVKNAAVALGGVIPVQEHLPTNKVNIRVK